jgi:drug/metabolite transporter (DMT)-like permease
MTWELFLIISVGTEVFGRLLQRVLLKNNTSDPIAYTVVVQLITGVLVATFAILQGFSIPDLTTIWPHLLIMPLLWGAANLFIYKSLKSTEASIFVVLLSTRALWQIIGAVFFLNEVFTLQQIMGTFFILGSVVLVSMQGAKLSFKKGEILALLAAIFFAAAMINDAFIVKIFDVESYLTFGFFLPALLIWAIHPQKTREIVRIATSSNLWKMVLLATLFGASAVTALLAYTAGNNAAQLGALFQMSTIITVFAAIFLLNERKSLVFKIIAGVISCIGVILII